MAQEKLRVPDLMGALISTLAIKSKQVVYIKKYKPNDFDLGIHSLYPPYHE